MKDLLKKIPHLRFTLTLLRTLKRTPGFLTRCKALFSYLKDFSIYPSLKKNPNFSISKKNIYPMIYDKTSSQGIDYVYFYQDSWCAQKVFSAKLKRHVDIASKAEMVGIISQFVPTLMVDIRDLGLSLKGLSFIQGDATRLPFRDNEIESLSSICVIEHIGLGRYGDPLDPWGSEKAAKELERVLAQNGNLYISVPIDSQNTIYFNAHRAFTRDYILSLFPALKLIEEKYIYSAKGGIEDLYNPGRGFGTGLFHFKKV